MCNKVVVVVLEIHVDQQEDLMRLTAGHNAWRTIRILNKTVLFNALGSLNSCKIAGQKLPKNILGFNFNVLIIIHLGKETSPST